MKSITRLALLPSRSFKRSWGELGLSSLPACGQHFVGTCGIYGDKAKPAHSCNPRKERRLIESRPVFAALPPSL
eukprot:6234716-Amphidinium_carterae.1